MENQRFMQEGIDGKRVLWLVWKKIWFFAGAVFAGAVLGGGIYLLVHLLWASQREYETVSKLYLNFNCDPEDFNELAYNGYTWNDLMATDPILDYTMEKLPPEVERETVIGATKAEILSDIRLLTVTITAQEPGLAAQIMEATQAALIHLGETDPLFESIEVYSTVEPKQMVWDNRTLRAAVTGAVIALFVSLAAAAFYYVMDDSVYVAADVEKRYGIPVIGTLAEGNGKLIKSFDEEFLSNYGYLGRNMKTVALVSVDSREDAGKTRERIGRLLEGKTAAERGTEADSMAEENGYSGGAECLNYGMPEEDTGVYAGLRGADGILVAVRFGGKNGKAMERLLGNLGKQDCKVLGAVIINAKEDFLRMYYRSRK